MDTRDNPVVVSGKGNIKFVVPEEKGPGKMLRKCKKRGSGWKVRKEKQRAQQRTELTMFLASVKKNLDKVMDQTEKQSLTRKFNSEGECRPESCNNVHGQKEDEDWKLIKYAQHTPKTTRVKEETKISQSQLM